MKKLRVALIGAGAMANEVHYPSLAEFQDVKMVGLCDLMEEKLRTTVERFHAVNIFKNYREMLDYETLDSLEEIESKL